MTNVESPVTGLDEATLRRIRLRRILDARARKLLRANQIEFSALDRVQDPIALARAYGLEVGPNVAHNLAVGAFATQVTMCPAENCLQTVVSYGDDMPGSHHPSGLSREAFDMVSRAVGGNINYMPCDKDQ
jgi:hypothetical protein